MTEGLKYAQFQNLQTPHMVEFLLSNWAALLLGLLALAKVVVNLTPTDKDNMVFGYVDMLINAVISDRRKKR